MKKYILAVVASFCLGICFLFPAAGFAQTPTLVINDKVIQSDIQPKIINGRLLVPIRLVSESLGAKVDWNGDQNTITIAGNSNQLIKLQINSCNAYVGDKAVQLDVPPQIIQNSTYVPLRFVGESLNADVSWDNSKYEAIIKQVANSRNLTQMSFNETGTQTIINLKVSQGTANVTAGTNQVVIDLPDTTDAIQSQYNLNTYLVSTMQVSQYDPSTTRLVLNLKNQATCNTNQSADSLTLVLNSNGGSNNPSTQGQTGSTAQTADLLSGPGVWTDIYQPLPGATDLANFKAAGVKRIYLEVGSSVSGFPQEYQDWINTLVPAAHQAGIKVIGWVYTSLSDTAGDAALIDQVANYKTPDGSQLDGVGADIEELPGDDTAATVVTDFATKARAGLPAGLPLLAITYPPQQKPGYPFTAMAGQFDGIILMDYWHTYSQTYTQADVSSFVSQSVATLKQMGCTIPLEAALEGCDIGAGMVTADEMTGAVAGAKAAGIGYSIFCYNPPDATVWTAFAGQ